MFAAIVVLSVSLTGIDLAKEYQVPLCHRGGWQAELVSIELFAEPEMEAMVRVAVQFWNDGAKQRVLHYTGRENWTFHYGHRPFRMVIRSATRQVLQRWQKISLARRGYTFTRINPRQNCTTGSAIWLDDSCVVMDGQAPDNGCRSPGFLLKMLVHEMGHGLGLPHSTERHSVMYESISESRLGLWSGEDTKATLLKYYGKGGS